mmetsp:Transcript_74121/g.188048  ORF Transcript_74121/g.188048 Transcript_74121/m.188048 type:complete len:410 (-) Transcript_74121:3-1232(-)
MPNRQCSAKPSRCEKSSESHTYNQRGGKLKRMTFQRVSSDHFEPKHPWECRPRSSKTIVMTWKQPTSKHWLTHGANLGQDESCSPPTPSNGHPDALLDAGREGLDGLGQRHEPAALQDDGLALADLHAANPLLLELQDVGTDALDIRETDVQRLVGRKLSEALLVPSGLEVVCILLRNEVDERIAHVHLASRALGQIQEVEIGGLVPLKDEQILCVRNWDVADHQCRHAVVMHGLLVRCRGRPLKRGGRSLERDGVLRQTLVSGAQLLVGTAFRCLETWRKARELRLCDCSHGLGHVESLELRQHLRDHVGIALASSAELDDSVLLARLLLAHPRGGCKVRPGERRGDGAPGDGAGELGVLTDAHHCDCSKQALDCEVGDKRKAAWRDEGRGRRGKVGLHTPSVRLLVA